MRGTKTIIERMEEAERIKETDRWLELHADLHEALALLDLAMHQGEYGVSEDVIKRYGELKGKYKQ